MIHKHFSFLVDYIEKNERYPKNLPKYVTFQIYIPDTCISLFNRQIKRTRQIIRYRATATLRRPQKKNNIQPQNGGGGYKTNRNII